MLSYLSNSVRPEIQMAVHQTARFSVNPMQSHKLAIMRIGRYLVDNPDRGIQYKIDKSNGLEVYVDADFAGGWSAADLENADNVLSRTGFVICYANCPIIWCSKLQTEIALSTAEAEYIAMSHALCETIPIQNLLYLQHAQYDDQFLYHSLRGQYVSYCYGQIYEVYTSH